MKAVVSLRALIARINRKLAHDRKMLKVARGAEFRSKVGDYYVVNFMDGTIKSPHDLDPEQLGRELGVLKDWEKVS